MKHSLTLSRYLAKSYLINLIAILFGLLALIYLFDTVELIRRASKSDTVPLNLVLQMGLLKLPEVGQILFPFAILFSAILTFWQLSRRSELVVMRSSGYSAWQFIMPLVLLSLFVGILQITTINPLGAILLTKYEQLENKHLNKSDNQIAIFQGGIWLRQSLDGSPVDEQDSLEKGYVILNSKKLDQQNWRFKNITALYFGENDNFEMRVDAKTATLEKGTWVFKDVQTHYKDGSNNNHALFLLPTRLTIQNIIESFSSPESMSFWELNAHIQTLEETGFDASRLRVHYQSLLAQPLFFASMILLAATVSLRPQRSGGTLILISSGIFIGFIVFFLSSYLQALGYSSQIPPALSAWSPSLICLLLGTSVIMTFEDG
ncbi:MAG: LPS export ABC transporter permease LptG [Micavibrio sp. TMED27]|nr:LPS export ABC transporter permease LptG [Micavibrio sp.]OUT91269.1 MAG: LPS export ABC transporter permease LptG [Micavibrio sp. TMED27]|tara:strand:+ start:2273 stop:3400 length:1128 start_codon:yes stop_codon:yes gene_type:complete